MNAIELVADIHRQIEIEEQRRMDAELQRAEIIDTAMRPVYQWIKPLEKTYQWKMANTNDFAIYYEDGTIIIVRKNLNNTAEQLSRFTVSYDPKTKAYYVSSPWASRTTNSRENVTQILATELAPLLALRNGA